MKAKIFLLGLTMLAGALLTSCREEEKISPNINIPGLGGTDEVENELDEWLYDNFTEPYNINVVYRWDAAQMYSTLTARLVPVEYDAVKPMMAVIRDVWFEPYLKAAGDTFLKKMAPKTIVLVGSPEYQSGSIKLGQAEGGRKILLLNANNFDPTAPEEDPGSLREVLHTIEHEFAHILHQTIMFDKEFQGLSAKYYTSSGWEEYSDKDAYERGFCRNYGMSGKDEDFVEIMSMIMVFGNDWFENTVLPAAQESTIEPNAYANLVKKRDMVEEYLATSWNIRFFDDPVSGEKGLVTYVQEAVNKAMQNPPVK